MSIFDLEANEEDKNDISIINKKEENNSNNSAQIYCIFQFIDVKLLIIMYNNINFY